ncbi:MAG: hypothetical protein ACOZAM_29485 [Pseudomonadota bacterium]
MEHLLSAQELRTAAYQASAVALSSMNEEIRAYMMRVAERLVAEAELLEKTQPEAATNRTSS